VRLLEKQATLRSAETPARAGTRGSGTHPCSKANHARIRMKNARGELYLPVDFPQTRPDGYQASARRFCNVSSRAPRREEALIYDVRAP
jgi:hypothetical protein